MVSVVDFHFHKLLPFHFISVHSTSFYFILLYFVYEIRGLFDSLKWFNENERNKNTTTNKQQHQKMEMKLVQAHWATTNRSWTSIFMLVENAFQCDSILASERHQVCSWSRHSYCDRNRFPCVRRCFFFHLLFCEFQRRKKKQRIKSYGVYFTYMAKIAYALWLIPNMLLAIVVSLLCSRSPIEIQMLNAYHSLLAARTCQIWFGIIVVNCN